MQISILDYLENSASRFPEKIVFSEEKKQISYGQLEKTAKAMGSSIIKTAQGVYKRPIVVFLDKGIDVLISFMGIVYSGNFYTPIDVHMPVSRINKILETLQPEMMITDEEHLHLVKETAFAKHVLLFQEAAQAEILTEQLENIRERMTDTDLLYILFTSGSTGTPKGVTICHKSVIDYTDYITDKFDITEKEIFGNQAPFYFDNSILDIYCTLKAGATMHIIPKELFGQPVLLLEYLKDQRINIIFWVPSALIMVSKLKAFRNVDISETLRKVLFCGEVMPNKQLNIWRKYLPDVLYANLYGPTEITDACTCYVVDREFEDNEPLPIGTPMGNTGILVLNEGDELVKGDEIGELCVRGTCLSPGYYNNPEKTREAFIQNPLNKAYLEWIYRTGDLVRYNEYGELIYLSRKDFQIKHMGHRIELGEIENAVSSMEGMSSCCCLYDEKRSKIVLFIEEDLEKETIINGIKNLVPDYMYPGKVIKLDKLPMNANGKTDRVALKQYL